MLNLDDLIWVRLKEPDDFLKIKETLTRMGIASKKEKALYQSCNILHKRGRYAIVHFKQLLALDGKETDFSREDQARTNTIANLLEEWGLLELEDPDKSSEPCVPVSQIKIIPYKDKANWSLRTKYSIGNKL